MINVYIFGCGKEYDRFSAIRVLYKDKMHILGIVTTNRQLIKRIDGYPCIIAEEMDIQKMDFVIIAVADWYPVARLLMEKVGIGEEKIIRSSVFYLPNFDLDEYLVLKRSDVTILSNNCLGG